MNKINSAPEKLELAYTKMKEVGLFGYGVNDDIEFLNKDLDLIRAKNPTSASANALEILRDVLVELHSIKHYWDYDICLCKYPDAPWGTTEYFPFHQDESKIGGIDVRDRILARPIPETSQFYVWNRDCPERVFRSKISKMQNLAINSGTCMDFELVSENG